MNVVCVFLDVDGNPDLRPLKNVHSVEAIHLLVLKILSHRQHSKWTFVLAFDPEIPLAPIAHLASYNAWQPTKQQLQELRDSLFQEELKRLQDQERQ